MTVAGLHHRRGIPFGTCRQLSEPCHSNTRRADNQFLRDDLYLSEKIDS